MPPQRTTVEKVTRSRRSIPNSRFLNEKGAIETNYFNPILWPSRVNVEGQHLPQSRTRLIRSYLMSPEQKEIVRDSWALVLPIADTAASMFYDRLFAIDPSTRPMFANTQMDEQKKKLLQALAFVISGLDRLDQLVPTIQNLGRNHVCYGVTEIHYDSVGAALLW